MSYKEFEYLTTTRLRKREVRNRDISKESYINHLLSVKIVNKYTLICVNELELMEYTRREIEFESTVEKLKNWYEHDYDLNLLDFDFVFPLLCELIYSGDNEAKNMYFNLINNKEKLEKLIDIDFYSFFKDIYEIYLKLLDKGEINIDLVKQIKLNDLRLFYYYQYQADLMENNFYRIIWDIVKNKLNIPFSMIDEDIIHKIFTLFQVELAHTESELNYKTYAMDYHSRYNKTFFREILDPLIIEIFTNEPDLKMQFMTEFNSRVNSLNESCPSEIILFDSILRCSELGEQILEYNSCGELFIHEYASIKEDDKYLFFPEFLNLSIKVANKIKKLRDNDKWKFNIIKNYYFDYTFLILLQKILFYTQKRNLIEDKTTIEELITFIEELKKINKGIKFFSKL